MRLIVKAAFKSMGIRYQFKILFLRIRSLFKLSRLKIYYDDFKISNLKIPLVFTLLISYFQKIFCSNIVIYGIALRDTRKLMSIGQQVGQSAHTCYGRHSHTHTQYDTHRIWINQHKLPLKYRCSNFSGISNPLSNTLNFRVSRNADGTAQNLS